MYLVKICDVALNALICDEHIENISKSERWSCNLGGNLGGRGGCKVVVVVARWWWLQAPSPKPQAHKPTPPPPLRAINLFIYLFF